MKLNIKPLADRVLVEPMQAETKTASGIIISDNAKEKPLEGKIVAISKEVEEDENLPLKEGDKVVFAKYSGTDITIEGKEYLVLNTDDILGIIE